MTNFGLKTLGDRRALYRSAAAFAAIAIASVSMPQLAHAQQETAQRTYQFNLPSQPLARSVSQIASTAGLQIMFDGTDATEASVPEVKGRMTAEQALARVLSGSGFTFQYVRPGVITLVRLPTDGDGGERVLGAVRVEGSQSSGGALAGATAVNGINGSRDVTATEGTRSYTTGATSVGGKTIQALKDTTQSVSVITDQRMKDQNLTDLNTVLARTPGITLVAGGDRGSSTDVSFYSRGFKIDSFSIDGGAGLKNGGGDDRGTIFFRPIFDMSLYDHVEVLRGAAGLFTGNGNPGATVNLVRKKPLDHNQLTIDASAGAWENYRVSVDATGPILFDGRLRGRAIMTWQRKNFFYDTANDRRVILSGMLEYDATPTTLISAGISYNKIDATPWAVGLPRYDDGVDSRFARSTCFCVPWARDNLEDRQIFGEIAQSIGDNWTLKLKGTDLQQNGDIFVPRYGGAISTQIDPNTGERYLNPYTSPPNSIIKSHQRVGEVTLDGNFQLLGREQKIILGYSYTWGSQKGSANRANDPNFDYDFSQPPPYFGRPTVDLFDFDPVRVPIPAIGNFDSRDLGSSYITTTAYVSVDLMPLPRTHILTGLRYNTSRWQEKGEGICTAAAVSRGECTVIGESISFGDGTIFRNHQLSWPPTVGLRYDLTDTLTLNASYNDIYQGQDGNLKKGGGPIDPIRGSNIEGGIKWAPNAGKLNVSLSGYRTRRKGFAKRDESVPYDSSQENNGGYIQFTECCFVNDPDAYENSWGIDFEVTGEILPGLQVAASYNYNKTEYVGAARYGGNVGLPLLSRAPQHMRKLWVDYSFGESSRFKGLSLSAGFNSQTSTFVAGNRCLTYGALIDNNGNPYVACLTSEPYNFTEKGWTVVNIGGKYRFNDRVDLSVYVENFFDKTYYQTVGDAGGGNWYGAPRNITVSLHTKF